MLEVRQLAAGYGQVLAVADLEIEVGAGQIVAVVGPNGAGKTTTLSTIAGLLRPRAGVIELDGTRIGGMAPEEIARLGISLVPEGRRIFAGLSVRENLLLGVGVRPSGARDGVDDDYRDMLARFPVLARLERQPAGGLSGGEQQQLAIARALMTRPRLLMLDEPSLGLAPKVVTEVFRLLDELRDQGLTILLVEQHAKRAVRLADYTYVLQSGRCTFGGVASAIDDHGGLHAAYLGAARSTARVDA